MSIAQSIRKLLSAELHSGNIALAQRQREATEEMLWRLRETERRELYLQYKTTSLHGYCRKHLKYSEGSAWRAVKVSRLLQDNSELGEKIRTGVVNLSTLSTADSFIRAEEARTKQKFTPREKKAFFTSIEDKSKDETEALMAETFPHVRRGQTKQRKLKDGGLELSFIFNREQAKNYERVREIHSHKPEYLSMAGLFAALLDENLDRYAPERAPERRKPHPTAGCATASPPPPHPAPPGKRGYISEEDHRRIHARANSQCELKYPDGTRCDQRYFLQVDHIIPLANGGKSEFANYQLLCGAHNRAKGRFTRPPFFSDLAPF